MKETNTQQLSISLMRTKFLALLVVTGLLISLSLTSCKSNSEKEADALENLNEANQNMENVEAEVSNDSVEKANDGEWQMFKREAQEAIAANEKQIISLRDALKKPGNKFTESYTKAISDLEEKNDGLQTRIDNYENNQTNWANFKQEFKNDMDNLGQDIKNATEKNK